MFLSVFRKPGQRQTLADGPVSYASDRRHYARARVGTEVSVRVRGETLQGHVEDVSISGLRLCVPLALEIGEPVQIVLEALTLCIDAKVIRKAGDDFGLAFDDPSVGVLFAGWSRGRELEGCLEF